MSIWRDIHDRSNGTAVRKEDIRKATMTVRITSTEVFGGYDGTRLTSAQKRSFRWHGYHLELRDERFKRYFWWSGGIITRFGDTGKKTIEGFVEDVLKEYNYFDGYACGDTKGKSGKEIITDKNRKMVSMIRKKVLEHNDHMMQEEE